MPANVKLCASGALLVTAIVTLPAFAASELAVNVSIPHGLAAIEMALAPAFAVAVQLPGVEDAVVAVLVTGAAVAALLDVLLELLPQPATAKCGGGRRRQKHHPHIA